MKLKTLILLSVVLAACNVSPQPPMEETPSFVRRPTLRITPVGQTIGLTNHFFTNGKKSTYDVWWAYAANKNSNLQMDVPVIFATECDPTKIQYTFTWALAADGTDNDQKVSVPTDTYTLAVDPKTKIPQAFVEEASGVYALRVHLSNTDQCQRISFKFNIFETGTFTPATTDPLTVGSPSTPQTMTVNAKTPYMTQAVHLFSIPGNQIQSFTILNPQSAACDPVASFALQTTDSTKNVATTPVAVLTPTVVTTPVDPSTMTFTTDPTKGNALLVSVAQAPGCQNTNYTFAVTPGPSPSPTPAPSPSPVAALASPSPTP